MNIRKFNKKHMKGYVANVIQNMNVVLLGNFSDKKQLVLNITIANMFH